MHPHIPRPRRKATRTCSDTAGVVRTVHAEFMWPYTARVNEKTAPIERIAAVAICRRLRERPQADLCSTVKRPTPGLRALPPMTAQIATALGPALDEPGALQQPSTVHVSEGSRAERLRISKCVPGCPESGTPICARMSAHSSDPVTVPPAGRDSPRLSGSARRSREARPG